MDGYYARLARAQLEHDGRNSTAIERREWVEEFDTDDDSEEAVASRVKRDVAAKRAAVALEEARDPDPGAPAWATAVACPRGGPTAEERALKVYEERIASRGPDYFRGPKWAPRNAPWPHRSVPACTTPTPAQLFEHVGKTCSMYREDRSKRIKLHYWWKMTCREGSSPGDSPGDSPTAAQVDMLRSEMYAISSTHPDVRGPRSLAEAITGNKTLDMIVEWTGPLSLDAGSAETLHYEWIVSCAGLVESAALMMSREHDTRRVAAPWFWFKALETFRIQGPQSPVLITRRTLEDLKDKRKNSTFMTRAILGMRGSPDRKEASAFRPFFMALLRDMCRATVEEAATNESDRDDVANMFKDSHPYSSLLRRQWEEEEPCMRPVRLGPRASAIEAQVIERRAGYDRDTVRIEVEKSLCVS